MKNLEELNITNLGNVPQGMSYAQAVESVKHLRKYFIDPYSGGHRLTICDTLRMSWRILDTMERTPEVEQLYEYLAQCFHYSKSMDARMKYLKSILDDNEIDYIKGSAGK